MRNKFRDLDLFSSHKLVRDVSAELFEKTLPGAWISVMGGLLMLLLFVAELHGYFTPSWTSEIVMADDDPTADNLLPISFDVSMPRVPCQYASVDVMDTLGRRRINITERVQRFKIDVNGGVLGSADPDPEPPAYGHVDHKDGEVLAEQLNVDSFESMLKSSELAMVNFYAPWCHWSRKLQPVWEHTAGILHDVDTGVKFGRVDCTDPTAAPLCYNNHIAAYPTIIIFQNGKTHSHKHYHGDRTPEALLKVIAELREHQNPEQALKLRRMLQKRGLLEGDAEVPLPTPVAATKPQECDDQGNGTIAAKPEGCRIVGKLFVHKVPGSVTFSLQSAAHSFEPGLINASHSVNMLMFGDPRELKTEAGRLSYDQLRLIQVQDRRYWSTEPHSLFEHHLKVVGAATHFANGDVAMANRLSVRSHNYVATELAPHVRFSYDLSPMMVVTQESYRPLYSFVTSCCAIIGGVFTMISLLDRALHSSLKTWQKTRLGKQG